MANFAEALKRPFSDWKKLGVGFLLYLIPIVNIITGFFAWGYQLECAHSTFKKKKELPAWQDWGNLFVRGLLALVISFIYAIPSIVIAVSFMFNLIKKLGPDIDLQNQVQLLQVLRDNLSGEIIVLVLILLITAYVTPMAIIFFSRNFEFKEAFMLNQIFSKIFSWKYLGAWLFLAVYALVISFIIQSLVTVVPGIIFIPWILNAFTNMFVGITRYTLLADVLRESK
ncbi:DUF4013 domain-containing protein [Candidatus Woesearchaeota archaeon]|nr:DUF4013 domain-containing protein [Candidatus Woesearchaeota archaeon]